MTTVKCSPEVWQAMKDMTDPQLEAPSVARATSEDAAEAIRPHTQKGERITLQLLLSGGRTDREIQEWTGWSGDFQRPRRIALVSKLLVEDSGMTRPTPSGRQAIVWQLTALGYQRATEK